MSGYIPLCVPWWEQQDALRAGARHDPTVGWYAPPDADVYDLIEWLPRVWDPTWIAPKLYPDMLPSTTWEDNVRTRVTEARWNELRKACYATAGGRCEICGRPPGTAITPHLEAHELWEFNDATRTQRLNRLIALCPLCHKAHHLGFANRTGVLPEVLQHIRRVNQWTVQELDAALVKAEFLWAQRSAVSWQIDIAWAENYTLQHFKSLELPNA